jgi:hypothetical protein
MEPSTATAFAEIVKDFDDGHQPGSTSIPTRIVEYVNKSSTNFFAIFDNLLESEWCNRCYRFALSTQRPWGVYITTTEALDDALDSESLWSSGSAVKAIALHATRKLIFERGRGFVGADIHNIHG